MTWSIVARDSGGAFGVAVASRFFAVGIHCPHARSAVGALCTQALVNPHYGPQGLDFMAAGLAPAEIITKMTAADTGRDHRQVHMIDAELRTAAYTGSACVEWCGDLSRDGFSVAGNMLAGADVLVKTAEAFEQAKGVPLAERLLAALDAGERAGGDKRGKQAAALRIHTTESYAFLDLRVDDHAEPLAELRRLYEKSLERYQPFVACLPSRAHPAGITDRAVIEREIELFKKKTNRP
jgi:uncharacterized Ntn-hydrolase superfamily protein